MRERLEAILIGARGDDLAIKLRRRIEVVIVEVEAGVLEPPRLSVGQHAERDAALEPQRLDARDHGADLLDVAVLGRAPGGAHAEPAGAGLARGARFVEHGVERHQLFRAHAGRVARALRTIGAVLRAAAGLDREQRRNLHRARIEIVAVNALRAEHQFGKRQREQRPHFLARPVISRDLARLVPKLLARLSG